MKYAQNWPIALLLLALLPIIIHMLNRLRYRTVQWAAMIFLLKANKAATRRAKLRQYLLLLFRALAIFFMIWAMMRPIVGGWLGSAAGGAPEVVVILLDRSASMEARAGAEDTATKRAHAIDLLTQAAKNSAGSRFVLIENVLQQPLDLQDAGVLATMQMAQPTDTAADIPAMLRAAVQYLVKNRPGSAEVWLASDFQSSNWKPESPEWADVSARFAGLPQQAQMRILDFSGQGGPNLSIAMRAAEFRPARNAPEQGALALSVEIKNSGGNGTFPLRTTRDGATSQSDLVLNAPVQRQAFKFDITKLPEGGGWGRLELPADVNPTDNAAYYVYRAPTALRAAIISALPAGRRIAAAAAPDPTRGDRAAEVINPAEANRVKWKETALIAWQGPSPAEAVSAALRAFVEEGGTLLLLPPGGDSSSGVLGVSWTAAENAREALRVATWEELDGPLARTDNGSSLPVGRLEILRRQIPRFGAENVRVHGLFADGQPFLVEHRVGKGCIFALATLPDSDWSTLGEGYVLLPMVQRMLQAGGERLAPPALATAGEWQPAEGEFWTPVGVEDRRDPRWQAGIYKHAGRLIALNRPDHEDAPEAMDKKLLESLLKGVKLNVMADAADLKADRLESEIWPAMIIATMLFMCLEMLLATSKGIVPAQRKPKVPVGSAPANPATAVTGGSAR